MVMCDYRFKVNKKIEEKTKEQSRVNMCGYVSLTLAIEGKAL